MELKEIKAIVNKAGFADESLMALNFILDGAMKRGEMTLLEKTNALKIVDRELDKGELDMDALADIAMAFTDIAEETNEMDEILTGDLEEVERAAVEDLSKINEQ